MNKAMPTTTIPSPASRWRHQPIYATTRLRCAIAMMVFAAAVLLSALPSFAGSTECAGEDGLSHCATLTFEES